MFHFSIIKAYGFAENRKRGVLVVYFYFPLTSLRKPSQEFFVSHRLQPRQVLNLLPFFHLHKKGGRFCLCLV